MVIVVKGGGRAPPTLTSQANFTLMMECTPEGGRYHSVCECHLLFYRRPHSTLSVTKINRCFDRRNNRRIDRCINHCVLQIGWPRNGYLVISRNTKLDEIKHFFRGISTEFREIPQKDFAKISHIFAKCFC